MGKGCVGLTGSAALSDCNDSIVLSALPYNSCMLNTNAIWLQ